MKTLLITCNLKSTIDFLKTKLQKGYDDLNKGKNLKQIFDNKSWNIKMISSFIDYEQFNFKDFEPDNVFIVPELNWEKQGVNDGYKIAKDLLINKIPKSYFQLAFISILKQDQLVKFVDNEFKSISSSFTHFDLLNDEDVIHFNFYSNVHFNLIKSLLISDSGKLDFFIHQYSSKLNDIEVGVHNDIGKLKMDIKEFVNELELFNDLISADDKHTLKTMSINEIDNQQLKDSMSFVKTVFDKIKFYQNNSNQLQSSNDFKISKSKYQVLIIDDEEKFRKVFVDSFSELFEVVVANDENNKFSIETAKEFIKENAKKFNVFILDLLYEKDRLVLNFNGLDLYNIIKKKNPYSTIRIITSLPRDIISKLIAKNLKDPIPFSHIFTKTKGIENLKSIIIDRSDEIIEECKINEKKKSMWQPFPKFGIFIIDMIPTYLFNLFYETPKEFQKIVDKSKENYTFFTQEGSFKTLSDWDGELNSPKDMKGITLEKFNSKLPTILTFRLLAFSFYNKDDEKIIISVDKWKEILSNISKLTPVDFTKDFTTKLGLGMVGVKLRKTTTEKTYQIEVKNLFPHEIEFIRNIKYDSEQSYSCLNKDQSEFFKTFIIKESMILFDVWKYLKLDFNPYKGFEKFIEENEEIEEIDESVLNYKNFTAFLNALLTYFNLDPDRFKIIIEDIICPKNQELFEEDEYISDFFDNLLEVIQSKTAYIL